MRDDVLEPKPEPSILDGRVIGPKLDRCRRGLLRMRAGVVFGASGTGKRTVVDEAAVALGGHRVVVEGESVGRLSRDDARSALNGAVEQARGGVLEVRNVDLIDPHAQCAITRSAESMHDGATDWRGILSTATTNPGGQYYCGIATRLLSLDERAEEMPLLVAAAVRRVHPLLVASVEAVEFCIAVGPWKNNFVEFNKAMESAAVRALRRKSHIVDWCDLRIDMAPGGAEDIVTANDD
jgi:hypothetical protein